MFFSFISSIDINRRNEIEYKENFAEAYWKQAEAWQNKASLVEETVRDQEV